MKTEEIISCSECGAQTLKSRPVCGICELDLELFSKPITQISEVSKPNPKIVTQEALHLALRLALESDGEFLEKTGGCTDGGCIIVRPVGMHTNGGCKCYRNNLKMQRLAHAHLVLVKAIRAALSKKEQASEAIPNFLADLALNQQPLGPEPSKLLHENAWDLYARGTMLDAAPPLPDSTPLAETGADMQVILSVSQAISRALKRLSFAAQTSGGTAGPDVELMAAIEQAEHALSMTAVSMAIDDIEALRKDAERYRWLRVQDWHSGQLAVVAKPKIAIKLGHDSPSRDRLDSAIDAAMSEGDAT